MHGRGKTAYTILVGKSGRKRFSGRSMRRCRTILKVMLRKYVVRVWNELI
jgi:hypothetical protein